MTRRRTCPPLYTPVAPFVEAIDKWLAYQTQSAGCELRRQYVGPNSMPAVAAIGVLAEMARVSVRTLNDYRNGEVGLIELRKADRLALALDIPLPLLADDFRPMHEWLKATEVAA